jgi:lipopolysaccharide transport system ATP-binding protein
MHEGTGTAAERSWDGSAKAPGGDVARLRRVRIKNESDQVAPAVDISEPVGFEMTFEVIRDGYTLLPHFQLLNDEGVVAFATLDVDPAWRKKKRPKGIYKSTAWVPGNFLSEGSFFILAQLNTLEPHMLVQFSESEAASFQVVDRMQGGNTARGDWARKIPGIVRPLLRWETEYTPA